MGILNNSKTLLFLALGVVALLFGTAGAGSGGAVDVWKKSTELQDNTATTDKLVEKYISGDGGLDDSIKDILIRLKNESVDDTLINDDILSYNYSEDGQTVIIFNPNNSSEKIEIIKTDFDKTIDNIITLDTNQKLVKTWKNPSFDLDGFNKDFEAILIYDLTYDKYLLFYKIDTEKFVLTGLDTIEMGAFDGGLNGIYSFDYSRMYGKFTGDTVNLNNIISLIGIAKNTGNLEIIYSYSTVSAVYGSVTTGFCSITNNRYYLNPTRFYSHHGGTTSTPYADGLWNGGAGCTKNSNNVKAFAVNEYESYSKDSLAVKSNSRTVGFDKATLVKQEISTGTGSERYLKIVSEQDFNSIISENQKFFTDFLADRIDNNIVTVGLDNTLEVDSQAYSIGSSVAGIVVDSGYINGADLLNGTVQVVEQIKFNPENQKGLSFDDLGLVTLTGTQVESLSFGNLEDNFRLQTHGTAYMVERSIWEQGLAVLWNVVTFDFSGVSQAWTSEALNPIIEDDKTKGSISGDTFGYTQSFKTPSLLGSTLTTSKPLTELLEYQGKNYWLFYTLEAPAGEKGCMIYDSLNSNLNVRIPVSTCGTTIAGTNSLSQFKIASD